MVEEFREYEKKDYLEKSIQLVQQLAQRSVDVVLNDPLKKAFKDKCAEAGLTLKELQQNYSDLSFYSAQALLNLGEETFAPTSSAAKAIKILIELNDMGILDLDIKGLRDLLGSVPDFMQYDVFLRVGVLLPLCFGMSY